jgi:hypothetical protein
MMGWESYDCSCNEMISWLRKQSIVYFPLLPTVQERRCGVLIANVAHVQV